MSDPRLLAGAEKIIADQLEEIERLQSLVLDLRERCRIQDKLISDNADLHDEIEGLGKELMLHDKAAELSAAEIERLREQFERVSFENAGLRAALKRIESNIGFSKTFLQKIAREALSDE